MQVKIEEDCSYIDLLGNMDIRSLVESGNITFYLGHSQCSIEYAYYKYNENNNHEEVLEKLKLDLIALVSICSKAQEESPNDAMSEENK